uniref:Reverse transcriptase domain-containing protein n=2 Tax=Caenorhabditis japonica TaxID=281687 RepID=A0A8R1ESJ8_CAEJA
MLKSDFLLYADDLKLFSSNENFVKHDLEVIADWCKEWQMEVAPNKCEAIRFSLRRKFCKSTVTGLSLNNMPISSCSQMLHEIRSSLCILFFYSGNLGSRIAGVQKVDHGYDVPLQVYRR